MSAYYILLGFVGSGFVLAVWSFRLDRNVMNLSSRHFWTECPDKRGSLILGSEVLLMLIYKLT